jgi:hypothetical protein
MTMTMTKKEMVKKDAFFSAMDAYADAFYFFKKANGEKRERNNRRGFEKLTEYNDFVILFKALDWRTEFNKFRKWYIDFYEIQK